MPKDKQPYVHRSVRVDLVNWEKLQAKFGKNLQGKIRELLTKLEKDETNSN